MIDGIGEIRPKTYRFIFITYLIESVIYSIVLSYYIFNPNDKSKFFSSIYIILIIVICLAIILFMIIIFYCKNSLNNLFCTIFLFIVITSIKLFIIYTAVGILQIKIFNGDLHPYAYLYWNVGTTLFYIVLIILGIFKDNINLLIYFGIGFLTSAIFFGAEYLHSKDIKSAGVSGIAGLIEIIFFCIAMKYSKSKNKLDSNKSLANVILIDMYKYFVIFLTLLLIPFLCCLLIHSSNGSSSGSSSDGYSGGYFGGYSSFSGEESNNKKPIKKEEPKKKKTNWYDPDPPYMAYVTKNGFVYDQYGKPFVFK